MGHNSRKRTRDEHRKWSHCTTSVCHSLPTLHYTPPPSLVDERVVCTCSCHEPSQITHPRPLLLPKRTRDKRISALLSSANKATANPSIAVGVAGQPGADSPAGTTTGALSPSGPKLWGGSRTSGMAIEKRPFHTSEEREVHAAGGGWARGVRLSEFTPTREKGAEVVTISCSVQLIEVFYGIRLWYPAVEQN